MRCIGVTWGNNNRKALEAAHAKTLVDKPADLLRIFSRHMPPETK
jgi:phosphoglycolate phosphatase-like HAD superfamily hydrolase